MSGLNTLAGAGLTLGLAFGSAWALDHSGDLERRAIAAEACVGVGQPGKAILGCDDYQPATPAIAESYDSSAGLTAFLGWAGLIGTVTAGTATLDQMRKK